MMTPVSAPDVDSSTTPNTHNVPYLCKPFMGESLERPPVWFMRQAGRYMEEYRAIRKKVSFLELCKDLDLATEVSLQPYKAFGMDAVIMFCDILIPPEAMGMELHFGDGGPKFAAPLNHVDDVKKLTVPNPADSMGFVMDLLGNLRKELASDPHTALIGFAGAPWTLATYMIEGGTSKNFTRLKGWMYDQPDALHMLLDKLTDTVIAYLNAQIDAGAQVVQLFDTWGGLLDEAGYREFVQPYAKRVMDNLNRSTSPAMYYINTAAHLTDAVLEIRPDGLSVDHRVPLTVMRERAAAMGMPNLVLQGNIDPIAMLAKPEKLKPIVEKLLVENQGQPHIFNVGHGFIPQTPTQNVQHVVDWVKAYGA